MTEILFVGFADETIPKYSGLIFLFESLNAANVTKQLGQLDTSKQLIKTVTSLIYVSQLRALNFSSVD